MSPTRYFSILVLLMLPIYTFAQCQIFDDNVAGSTGLSGDTISIAQGFIAECDGTLEYAQFVASSNGTSEVFGTFNLYEGNGLDGALIHSEPYAAGTIFMLDEPMRATIEGDVSLVEGNQYTFELVIDNQVGIRADSDMTYLGGAAFSQGFESTNYDFIFEVSLLPTLGVSEFDNTISATVYPNPASRTIQVSGFIEQVKYQMYTINGEMLSEGVLVPGQTIAVEELFGGVYFLKFETGQILRFLKK
ncbi:MAG: T9SS type A sorting domain-containing protein [Bacteroidetes bacterium]|nr:T9SS type A sorting domain-containing protein [Bacteroidota bacterium]